MVPSGFFVHFKALCNFSELWKQAFYNILRVFWVKKLSLKQTKTNKQTKSKKKEKKRKEKKNLEEFHLTSFTGECSLPLSFLRATLCMALNINGSY